MYALGPAGFASTAAGALNGRWNAEVAPSEGTLGSLTAGLSKAGVGTGGMGKVGGIATVAGGFGLDSGAGTNGSFKGGGKAEKSSTGGLCKPEGGAALVPEGRGARFGALNQPVKPVPGDSFPAEPPTGSSARGGLNIAVKSPTLFRGGSIG